MAGKRIEKVGESLFSLLPSPFSKILIDKVNPQR
jgi:hypothetical protein